MQMCSQCFQRPTPISKTTGLDQPNSQGPRLTKNNQAQTAMQSPKMTPPSPKILSQAFKSPHRTIKTPKSSHPRNNPIQTNPLRIKTPQLSPTASKKRPRTAA